jgi:methylglutaconyl-CoA hydratase
MKHSLKRPEDLVLTEADGIARLTLNRPQIRNAFDDVLIQDLTLMLSELAVRKDLRCLVLAGEGKSFSAGADLEWMRRAGEQGEHANFRDAHRLAELMQRLDTMPMTTIARVQGAAMGGGVGLTACCDIAIAGEGAIFALSEVKLGIIPAGISPFVIRAIGVREARRYFQTGERFDAATAKRLGLVHEVVPDAELDSAVEAMLAELRSAGPASTRAAKVLIGEIGAGIADGIDDTLLRDAAQRIATQRATPEAKEGLSAFLEKRKPNWTT